MDGVTLFIRVKILCMQLAAPAFQALERLLDHCAGPQVYLASQCSTGPLHPELYRRCCLVVRVLSLGSIKGHEHVLSSKGCSPHGPRPCNACHVCQRAQELGSALLAHVPSSQAPACD